MAVSNKVKFGICNLYYAVMSISASGEVTYAVPKPIPGAVSITLEAQGETNTIYADNMEYYVSTGNDGYSGTLEVVKFPDDFRKDVLGEVEDAKDKVLIEYANAELKHFALLFQSNGNFKPIRYVFYNCVATRPGISLKTTERDKTPQTETISLTSSALADARVHANTLGATTEEIYNNWFSSVWKPGA